MPEPRRESVDVTALLRNVLDNYPAGSAVIRELLQNTDDSGATTQASGIFILDTRTFPFDALVDPALISCQGPAIIAINDGYFLEEDWAAITEVHNSSKKGDETSTGKYGLGFRSSYHVTDNPQVLSGDTLLILDPHQRVKRFPGGFQLSTNNADRQDYRGHFDTFNAVFSPNDRRYEGTAIRLPLRLDASQSRIKSTATSVTTARQMFLDFMTKDLGECMLFLKHITSVRLIEIADDGRRTTLARSWIDNAAVVGPFRSRNRGRHAEMSDSELTINVQVGENITVSQWIIIQFVEEYGVTQKHLEERLGRSSVAADMVTEKFLPHVALAFPVARQNADSSQFVGRLFTLLPLPIFTGFPLHINAVLALTSSRQSLRRTTDVVKGSKEEFLVEWNKVIFSELVPKAWAALFRYFAAISRDIDLYAAWPPFPTSNEGDRMYWQTLPTRLLEEAGPMAIWPVQLGPGQSRPACRTLRDIFVAPPSLSELVSILRICGIPITTAPSSSYQLIQNSITYCRQLLTPAAVHQFLKKIVSSFPVLDAAAIKAIRDYLTTGGDITLLYDIPIFLNCQGGYTPLLSGRFHTLATDIEASLFQAVDADLLMLDDIPPATRSILEQADIYSVHFVRPTDVAQYLSQTFSQPESQDATISIHIEAEGAAWLALFWNWVNTWDQAPTLFDETVWEVIQQLYIIPLDAPAEQQLLRRLSSGAVDGRALDPGLNDVLRAIGVPILHPDVLLEGQIHDVMTRQANISFVLENVSNYTSFDHLDQGACQILHSFLAEQLSIFHRSGQQLSSSQQATLRGLPVFPILFPGIRSQYAIQTFGTALQSFFFVDHSVQVVPSISGLSFIDGREGAVFAQGLAQGLGGEMDVLTLVLEPTNWAQQDYIEGLEDLLVDRLARRLNEFDDVGRTWIADLRIIEVGAKRARVKPSLVVDPQSKIACLYDAEDGVLPYGRFAEDGPGTLLHQFRSFGMFRSTLDESTIIKLVTALGVQFKPFAPREKKALLLLPLLDEYASSKPSLPRLQITLRAQKWLPANGKMYRSSECWDSRSSDTELADFVVPLVPVVIHSSGLRDALGWKNVPSNILQAQLVAVVQERPLYPLHSQSHSPQRIIPILRKLSQQYQRLQLSDETLKVVVEGLGDRPWVPVALDICRRPEQTMLDRIELGTRFQRVYSPLIEQAGLVDMLRVMGVCDRPSPSALLTGLQSLAGDLSQAGLDERPKGGLVMDSVAILHEISLRPLEFDLTKVLILDEMEEMRPINSVIFNDRRADAGLPPLGSFFVHSSISRSVAMALGIRQLSDEEFDREDEDVEAFHMVEELSTRVRNTLKGYELEYASNEWVANANDAGASTIKFMIHESTFTGTRLLGPDMKQFQEVPSLIVYNDGVFAEEDFKGIGSVGLGGKRDTPGTIGRFGLGAFSFYHFTELLMIVSAGSVLFLDPSQSYLPRKKGLRQTGIKMSLSLCRARYPDQLRPLDGIFGFDRFTENYQGTLFQLPLRTASQATQSKLSTKSFTVSELSNVLHRYFGASTQSMFFSKMESISALHRLPNGTTLTIWSVEGSRSTRANEEGGVRVELEIRESDKAMWKEHWLVCTSSHKETDFPEALQPLFKQHRLPSPNIGVALNTSSKGNPSRDLNFCLFATLPLPVSTSLPAHVHATWILSDDRRSLRYDSPDGTGRRPLDAEFNEYILQSLVPPLYLHTLAIICSHNHRQLAQCWPKRPTDPVSQAVSFALYSSLKDTEKRVLRTVSDETIAPKNALIHVHGRAAVGRVLASLNLQDFVLQLPFDSALVEEWDFLETDRAHRVADLLREHYDDVKRFYETDITKSADIDAVLRYLLNAETPIDLTGVPLLQVGNGQITSFKSASEPKVFCTSRSEVASLFGRDKIIGLAIIISQKTVERLCALNLNVQTLNVEGMRELLYGSEAQVVPGEEAGMTNEFRPWYDKVLDFLTRQTSPVKLEDLANLPLIPTSHKEVVISLDRARQPDVWWQSPDDQAITPVLEQCEIHVVQFPPSWLFKKHDVDIASVLDIFGSSGTHLQLADHEVLSNQEWAVFAEWTKEQLTPIGVQRLNLKQLHTLGRLPLFSGQQGETQVLFASASNISMLPAQVTAGDISRYLPSQIIFSSFSPSLQATLGRLAPNRCLSIQAVLSQLALPNSLPQNEEAALKSVISIIWEHSQGQATYDSPLVPDENWNLRVPSTLYDGNVAVFRQSFQNRPEAFVHPNFHDILDKLVPLGVHRFVTPGDIVICARAVDQDSRTEGMDARVRAEYLWNFINEDFNDARRLDFSALSSLRFIPSHQQRHPIEPAFSRYCQTLPDVLSMNELCLAQHAQAIWTQRATFAEPPSAITRAISQELGVPTIQEMVAHLVALATVVANEHSESRVLLSDIRHTYISIHEQAAAAKPFLLQHKGQRIWLNVDDPATENWVWRSARELVFDLRYDNAKFYDVKSFLEPYRELVLAAGAEEYRYATLIPLDPVENGDSSHAEMMWKGWQDLRIRRVLFDIQFVVQGESIKAHRGVLAAVVPHFSLVFTAGFRESESLTNIVGLDGVLPIYPMSVDTSLFAVRSVVDYVYTGKFDDPSSETTEESEMALEALLDLLELADFWQLEKLKLQAIRSMVTLQLVRAETCDDILERAQMCNAPELVEVCRQNKANNPWI